MRRILIWIALALAAIFIVAGVYYYYVIYPWMKMPDVDLPMIENRMAQYQSMAEDLGSRSKADRNALGELAAKVKKEQAPYLNINIRDWCKQGEEGIKAFAPHEKEFAALLAPYLPVFDEGVIIFTEIVDLKQNDLFGKNLSATLKVAKGIILSGVAYAWAGKTDTALTRFNQALDIIDGLYGCPLVLHLMMGATLENYFDLGLLFVLPKMDDESLGKLSKRLHRRSDPAQNFIKALQTEIVFGESTMKVIMTEEPGEAHGVPPQGSLPFWFSPDKYFERERLFFLDFSMKKMDAYEKWIKGETKSIPKDSFADKKTQPKSLLTQLMYPDVRKLAVRMTDLRALSTATIKAVDMARRPAPDGRIRNFELPVHNGHKIVVNDKHGCLVSP